MNSSSKRLRSFAAGALIAGLASAVHAVQEPAPAPEDPAPIESVPAAQGWVLAEQQLDSDAAAAAQAAAAGLAGSTGDVAGEHQQLAFEILVQLASEGRHEQAEVLAAPLHERVAADWTAVNLCLVLSQTGRFDQADAVLHSQLPRSTDPAELWNQRALLASGQGHADLFRARLGRAVRLGSANAALSLARADALAGRLEAARAGYRAGCDRTPPAPWSLRGWALTLLP